MKRKLFSILTALALCLSLCPFTASAETTTVNDPAGLRQAFSDANSGGTVSVRLGGNIDTDSTQLELTGGSLTLDLNGHELSGNANNIPGQDGLFHVAGGSLTLEGSGSIENKVGNPAITMASGSIVINGSMTLTGTGNYTINITGGSLEVKDGTVSNTNQFGDAIQAGDSSTVTLSGGTFSVDRGSAIALSNGQKLSDLLKYDESTGGHLAYEQAGSVVAVGPDKTSLQGTVAVAQCIGTVENATNNNDGTHSGACSVCGRTLTESHTWENGSCVCGAKLGTETDPWPCGAEGDNLTAWLSSDGKTLTISGTGAMEDYYVSGNESPWHGASTGINKVVLPPTGLTTIGEYAFYGTNLQEVTIPEGVTTIGANAFQASNLKEVTIPAGVTRIGSFAFQACTGLQTVTFEGETPPEIVREPIGSFRDCAKLTTINVPHGREKDYKAALTDTGIPERASIIAPEGHDWKDDGSCVCGAQAVAKVEIPASDPNPTVTYYETVEDAWAAAQAAPSATVTLLADVTLNDNSGLSTNPTNNGSLTPNITFNGGDHTVTGGSGKCIFSVDSGSTLTINSGTFKAKPDEIGRTEGCVDVSSGGTLNVTGGTLELEGQNAYTLSAESGSTIQLSAGTYSGGRAAIAVSGDGKTLADVLDTGCGIFKDDGTGVARTETTTGPGTFTVKTCTHEGVKATPDGGDMHSVKCPYCGHTGTAGNCSYGGYEYDGDNHWTTCTVCGGKDKKAHEFENGVCKFCGAKTPLDLSAIEDSSGTGYTWKAVKNSEGKITSGTLTLNEGFSATKVILPDAAVTIVTNGESTIGKLIPPYDSYGGNPADNMKLTFSGKGKLSITQHVEITNGDNNSITVAEGAKVEVHGGISIGASGSVNGLVTVKGMLTIVQGDGVAALNTGRVAVGDEGVLEVSGTNGVLLNGMNSSGDFTNLFTVSGNGRFTADCSNYNLLVQSSGTLPTGTTAEGAIHLDPDYMPDDCKVELEGNAIKLMRKNQNGVYDVCTGPLTIHKNHTWKKTWTWNGTTHWHACEYPGCTEKQPGSEAAHFYRNCACTICPYQAPAGTPDSGGGGGGGDRPVHTHSWSAEWSSDSTRHWHACRGCSQRKDLAEHVYDDEWDANCNICGYVREVAHRHIWAEAWSRDETSHWHECTAPDCDITDNSLKDGYEPHVYDDEWDATCNICGYVREVAHRHIWAEAWSHDETSHWHECAAPECDITDNSLKDGYGAHVYDGGWDAGCNTCGYVREVDYPPVTPGRPTEPGQPSGGGSSVSSYKVTVEPSAHGNVTSNRAWATEGGSVTLTVTPDAGYELNGLTVTDSRGDTVELTGRGGGYTFTMPGRPVTVSASFRALRTEWTDPYTDVRPGAWYYDAVRFVTENDLMDGFGKGVFGPNSTLTRAQFAQILFNSEGRPAVNYLLRYNDLTPGAWYTEAVRWAASEKIMSGVGGGRFAPNDPITREQLAATLWRYAGSPAAAGQLSRFNDAGEVSGYAREAMSWAVENGILQGSGGQLSPRGQATRGEAAQMLKNFIENTDWSAARGV